MSVLELVRPEILKMRAYVSARSLTENAGNGLTFLDANESAFPQSADAPPLNRYPEPQPRALVKRFAELYAVPENTLLIGRGSDEAIDLLVRTFCRAGTDSILICPPTYGMYEVAAEIQGAAVIRVPLLMDGGMTTIDEPGILSAMAGASVKIIFLCSPNNPTGTSYGPAQLSRICESVAGRAIVVVDEAYAEFADFPSMIHRLNLSENLVVLRTLSKAWAMAGVRCGCAIAAPELIELLHKVRAPYPLSQPAIDAVLEGTSLDAQLGLVLRVRELRQTRAKLAANLKKLPQVTEIFESHANYLLVRFENSKSMMNSARAAGIVIRDRSAEPGLTGCIRITVGTEPENAALISAFSKAGA